MKDFQLRVLAIREQMYKEIDAVLKRTDEKIRQLKAENEDNL